MCYVAVIFLALCAPALSTTIVNKALWKSTPLDVSSITAGAHAEVTAPSEFLCAARTLQQFNSSLYCFDGDRCVVPFTFEREPLGSPVLNPWACKCVERICPDGFEFVACAGCFHFSTTKTLFDDAKTECQNMGASLASLSVLSEYEAIRQYIMQEDTVPSIEYLLDLLRVDDMGFVWGDGTFLSSAVRGARPWADTQPWNVPQEVCAIVYPPRNFYVGDAPCGSYAFICRV